MSAGRFGGSMASLETYEILPEQDLVIVPCVGGFDLAWWRALMDAVLRDPRYRPGMSFLVERRRVRSAPTAADVAGMSEYVRTHGDALRGGRWAVVAPTRSELEVARRLVSATERHGTVTMCAFKDEAPAMAWLLAGDVACT